MKEGRIIDIANAPELSDEELYATYVEKKDREIIAALYRKYMALVFGVCMKYLREKTAAQDATMEVFERLLNHQPTSEIRNFRAFLYVVSKNHCLMLQRSEKPTTIEIASKDMEIAMELHPIDKDQENMEAKLEKCLKELKDLQQQCVAHFYLNKKSYMLISKELKLTLNAVKSHIQNGKRNLRSCIEASK